MNIDNLPIDKLIDEQGNVSEPWRNHFQQNITQIQTFLSNESYNLPHQPAKNAPSNDVTYLNVRSKLGGAHYHSLSNNMKVNLEKYESGSSEPTGYEFVPQLSYHEVASIADRDAMPADKSEGKIVIVTGDNTKAYIYVLGGWRTITLT